MYSSSRKFEVAKFNGCDNKYRGPNFFGVFRLAHTPANFGTKSCFGKLLLKPKLCAKIQVVRFNSCRKLNGGLSRLHCGDEDAVSWLTNYG